MLLTILFIVAGNLLEKIKNTEMVNLIVYLKKSRKFNVYKTNI